MPAVFIAQSMLQDWADKGKVRLDDTTLILLKEHKQVDLIPAVRFTEVIGGEEDPHKLVGKVKSKSQLAEMDAEHYMDSVLCGDVAYQVVEGFLGDLTQAAPMKGPAPAAAPPAEKPPAAVPAPVVVAAPPPSAAAQAAGTLPRDVDPSDAEALSRLFLDTVR